MNDDDRRIIITKIYEDRQTDSSFNQRMTQSPINRWLAILVLIPIIIIMAILGAFFFAAFLALFTIAAGVFGARFWWLRRKLRKTTHMDEGDHEVIEDAQIIEEIKTKQKKDI
jgi:hypothetical protein